MIWIDAPFVLARHFDKVISVHVHVVQDQRSDVEPLTE